MTPWQRLKYQPSEDTAQPLTYWSMLTNHAALISISITSSTIQSCAKSSLKWTTSAEAAKCLGHSDILLSAAMKPFPPQKASHESLYSRGQGQVKSTNVGGFSPHEIPHEKEDRVQCQGDVQGHSANLTSNPGNKVNKAGRVGWGRKQARGWVVNNTKSVKLKHFHI